MIFRGLTASSATSDGGDWEFGQGISSYTTGSAAVALNVKTALQTFLGDAFWDATFGIDWINLLGHPGTLNAILAQTRAMIAGAEGVTSIVSVNSNVNRQTRTLFIQYTYTDVYAKNVSGVAQITV
jgi:hypothetical protein